MAWYKSSPSGFRPSGSSEDEQKPKLGRKWVTKTTSTWLAKRPRTYTIIHKRTASPTSTYLGSDSDTSNTPSRRITKTTHSLQQASVRSGIETKQLYTDSKSDSKAKDKIACIFWFLGCHSTFASETVWVLHCKGHFHGRELPKLSPDSILRCFRYGFGAHYARLGPGSGEAIVTHAINYAPSFWDYLQEQQQGVTGPDRRLLLYLWKEGIISFEEYNDLRLGGRWLEKVPEEITISSKIQNEISQANLLYVGIPEYSKPYPIVKEEFSEEDIKSRCKSSPCEDEKKPELDSPSPIKVERDDSVRYLTPDESNMVSILMSEFHHLWKDISRPFRCAAAASSTKKKNNSNNTGLSGQGSDAHRTGQRRQAKRPRLDSNQENEDGSDASEEEKNRSASIVSALQKKLACPYFKRNPAKYQHVRPCLGPGWSTVHRLKEHLYRRHSLALPRCSRCYQQFQTHKLLQDHSRLPTACEIREAPSTDNFDAAQEQQLRSRKRRLEQSEEDQWREVYRILFPDDDFSTIPSPYYDEYATSGGCSCSSSSTAYQGYQDFLNNQIPDRMRTRLELEVSSGIGPLEERQIAPLVDILRECMQQAHSDYMARLGQTDTTAARESGVNESQQSDVHEPFIEDLVSFETSTNLDGDETFTECTQATAEMVDSGYDSLPASQPFYYLFDQFDGLLNNTDSQIIGDFAPLPGLVPSVEGENHLEWLGGRYVSDCNGKGIGGKPECFDGNNE